MRYCNNCGSSMGNGRFCTNCGADNGEVQAENKTVSGINVSTGTMTKKDLYPILNMVTVGLYAVVALINLTVCLSNAETSVAYSMLYRGGFVLAIAYFAVGMCGVMGSLSLIFDTRESRACRAVRKTLGYLFLIVAMVIFKTVGQEAEGVVRTVIIIFSPYIDKAANIIFCCILTVVSAIATMRTA